MSAALAPAMPTAGQAPVPSPDIMGFKPYVQALGRGETLRRDLTQEEARDALDRILGGRATAAQMGAFFMTQRVKGESSAEIRGFVEAVRDRWMMPLTPAVAPVLDMAVPYDGKERTAQLAPAIALVLAACGLPVLLHGAQDVPTKAGVTPSHVLAGMGIPINLTPRAASGMLDDVGFAYCGAEAFMPAWHALLPMREEFGLRTVLNTVEKLINPASAAYQVTGFYHTKYIDQMRTVQTGQVASWIIQGEEGSIEMRAGRKTRLYGVAANALHVLDPEALGFPERTPVEGSSDPVTHIEQNLAALTDGNRTAQDQVVLSAGVILGLFGVCPDFAAGIEAARQALTSGRAARLLAQAQTYSCS